LFLNIILKLLFVHQNFPGQYMHIAAALAASGKHEVVALGEVANAQRRQRIPGVNLWGYKAPAPASRGTHHYVKPLEAAVRRGQVIVRACADLKRQGFTPDVICAHPGWGEALFLKDVYPHARVQLYCEFFYRAQGADVGFDPEFPSTLDDQLRVRIKNSATLISLELCDSAVSPTQWQKQLFPREYQPRINVVHEGIDTDLVKPDAHAKLQVGNGVTLSAQDEVITFVARNLEPYRGFHIFMRTLPQLLARRPHAHVVIVGGDDVSYGKRLSPGENYKQKLLAEVGSTLDLRRVHFMGSVPYTTLLKVYQVSSVHVYLTYPFVLSWSLLEAMAAGCVVVASRTAPVEEVITHRKNGFLVDFFNPAEMVEQVDDILQHKPEASLVREQARNLVINRYDLSRVSLPAQVKLIGAGAA
jgi:glycosyltransferase involved in cell wall biosynthesis